MNRVLLAFVFLMMIGCKSKREKKSNLPAENFFVNDYIKGQIARLDTAGYAFHKVETKDGHSDTTPIKNSEVQLYAKDFLNLPDISSSDIKDDYEVSHLFDELQEAFIFTYMTKEDHPVKRQDITVEPEMNAQGKNDIRMVYVDYWDEKKDSLVRKNLLWEANKSFQVTSITELPGQPEKLSRFKVIWSSVEALQK